MWRPAHAAESAEYPFVFDPFAFKTVDAVLATHYHQDHMSPEWAAHVINSGMTTVDENGQVIPVPFIGPKKSVELWQKWGVPAERCITVKPGDSIRIKDLEIIALDSFDRTCLVTTDKTDETREELTGICPTDMDDKAVNYLIRTPGAISTIPAILIIRFISPNTEKITMWMWPSPLSEKTRWACRTR